MFIDFGFNRETLMDVEQRGKKRRMSAGGTQFTPKTKAKPVVTQNQIKMAVQKASEMKYYDLQIGFTALAAAANDLTGITTFTGGTGGICNPAVGAASNQRVGKMIYLHKIRCKGAFTTTKHAIEATGEAPIRIRFLIFRDKEPPQAAASSANLTELLASTGVATTQDTALQNVNNFGRFEVLKDKTYVLQNPNSATATNALTIPFKFEKRFANPIKIRFNDSTTAFPTTDQFQCIIFINQLTAAQAPLATTQWRACFKDE